MKPIPPCPELRSKYRHRLNKDAKLAKRRAARIQRADIPANVGRLRVGWREHLPIWVAVLLLLATIALCSCTPADGSGTVFSAADPPERFQTPRTFVVAVKGRYEINEFCQALTPNVPPPGKAYMACSTMALNVAYIPNPCEFTGEKFAQRLCHEMGHLNGWPGTHPR